MRRTDNRLSFQLRLASLSVVGVLMIGDDLICAVWGDRCCLMVAGASVSSVWSVGGGVFLRRLSAC